MADHGPRLVPIPAPGGGADQRATSQSVGSGRVYCSGKNCFSFIGAIRHKQTGDAKFHDWVIYYLAVVGRLSPPPPLPRAVTTRNIIGAPGCLCVIDIVSPSSNIIQGKIMLSVPSLLLEPENDLLRLHPIKDIIRFFRFRHRHDLIRHESVICGVISTHHSLREDRGAYPSKCDFFFKSSRASGNTALTGHLPNWIRMFLLYASAPENGICFQDEPGFISIPETFSNITRMRSCLPPRCGPQHC